MPPFRHALTVLSSVVLLSSVFGCSGDGTESDADDAAHDVGDAQIDGALDAADGGGDADDASEDSSELDATSDVDDTGSSEDTDEEAVTLAEGISITRIEAFQTVGSVMVDGGETVQSDVPLVSGRDTLIRVLVETDSGWTPRETTAQLMLPDGPTLESTRDIAGTSNPEDRATAFEFVIDGAHLTPQTGASIRILGDGPTSVENSMPSEARWPADGSAMPLDATDRTGTLHLVLVPFRYEGRLPDTSEEQLAIIEDALRALYPATELRLEVRDPIDWDGYVDFGDFNRELRTLKQADGATEAYYYGMIRPAETFADYCSGTCTTGQSFTVSSADSASYRVGSGVGFSGERWAWTLVHELGHMHGRGHAPCDVSWWSDDDNYPHSGGIIGVRAWDGRSDTLLGASDATDFMGYCDNLWASDYTYMGIFERMRQVHDRQQPMSLGPERTWHYINWSDTEGPRWGRTTREPTPFSGAWATATYLTEHGRELATERVPLVKYAHGGERSVLAPQGPDAASHIRIDAPERRFELEIPSH